MGEGTGGFHKKSVLGPLDLFWPFSLFYHIHLLIYDWSPWFMIYLPPAGGGNRTRDLVVESRVRDHWAIPVIPSKWYPKYPLVPQNKKYPTTFRNYPPPSEKICFEAVGPFWTFFPKSQDPKNAGFDKNDFFVSNIWKNSSTMSLFLILSTWWTYSQPIWIEKVKQIVRFYLFPRFFHFGPTCWRNLKMGGEI